MTEQAKEIEAGLELLGPFLASKCAVCEGAGQYVQWYTIGCGMGSYKTMGKCDRCDGTGMIIGDQPALESVVNQVREAGRRAMRARE